jgi:hypothetical protein
VREREYKEPGLAVEDVAEFEYRPARCKHAYRIVALRKKISVEKGQEQLFEQYRYFFYITNEREAPVEQIVFWANDRCDQENLIEQMKNGVHAMRNPLEPTEANRSAEVKRYREFMAHDASLQARRIHFDAASARGFDPHDLDVGIAARAFDQTYAIRRGSGRQRLRMVVSGAAAPAKRVSHAIGWRHETCCSTGLNRPKIFRPGQEVPAAGRHLAGNAQNEEAGRVQSDVHRRAAVGTRHGHHHQRPCKLVFQPVRYE